VVLLHDAAGLPIIAGYDVQEELGRGPFGVVLYRARQLLVGRTVLLKVVAAREDPGQQAWGSLRGEASALGRLSHPNIVHIDEAGERERQLFYNAVEYVDGPTLAQKVADRPLPFAQVMRLVETLALAVAYAHGQGIVHRNLKPASVLLQPAGQAEEGSGAPPATWCVLLSSLYLPRLTDFGLARRPVEGDINDLELFREAAGFLAPEQVWGRAREIGQATDVYGLGGILYFLLTGRPPYPGRDPSEAVEAIQSAHLVPPSQVRSGVPPALEAICRKCLTPQPRRRYGTAAALAEDLRRCAAGLPLKGRPTSAFGRFGLWLRRKPLAALLALVLLAGVVVSLASHQAGKSDAESAQHEVKRLLREVGSARSLADSYRRQLEALRQQERFTTYRQQLAEAQRLLAAGQRAQAGAALDGCAEDQRHWEWHQLKQQTNERQALTLGPFAGAVTAVAFSPGAGTYVAAAGPVRAVPFGEAPGVVRLWHTVTGKQTLELGDFTGPVRALAWNTRSPSLAAVGGPAGRGELRVFNLDEGPQHGAKRFAQDLPGALSGVVYTPDGAQLIAADENGGLYRLSADGSVPPTRFGSAVFRIGGRGSARLALGADGQRLAVCVSGENLVRIYNTADGAGVMNLPGEGRAVALGAGSTLAVARADGTIGIQEMLLSGPGPAQLLTGAAPATQLAFSADGKRLAAASGDRVRVWGTAGGRWVEVLTLSTDGSGGLAFSPTGRLLATAGGREVRLWGAP
jgi:serine/threonine protein kinase